MSKHKKMIRIYTWLTSSNIEILLYIILLTILSSVLIFWREKFQFSDFLEVYIIVLAFLVSSLAKVLSQIGTNKFEDALKLTTDYKKLVDRYPVNKVSMVQFKRSDIENVIFPIVILCRGEGKRIIISDKKDKYVLPAQVKDNYTALLNAHATSTVYNQLNIRLDEVILQNDAIILHTSRTTYFDSLVTNRSMDFLWENGLTNRDLYGYGPRIEPLETSMLSNHIGFNCFVITSDCKVPFVLRDKNVSVGKNTLGCSVSASLKAMYALDVQDRFTEDGMLDAIKQEILDELRIETTSYEMSLQNNLIAIYRDLVEGGKPQLLLSVNVNLTSEQILYQFKKFYAGENENYTMLMDGGDLVFISVSELQEMYIDNDYLLHDGISYTVTPSTAASVIMLSEYLNDNN